MVGGRRIRHMGKRDSMGQMAGETVGDLKGGYHES